MRTSSLWAIGALLLGLGAGYLLGSTGPDGARDDAIPVDEGAALEDSGEAVEATLMSSRASAPGPTTAWKTAAADEKLRGDGFFHGFVREPDGRPLEGAVVIAWPIMSDPRFETLAGNAPPPAKSDAEALAGAVRYAARRHAATGRAVTDAAGAYRITGLGDLRFHCYAQAKGYQIVAAPHDYGPDGDRLNTQIDFVATRINTAHVRVLDPDGRLAAKAKVRGHANRDSRPYPAQEWTPERDWINLTSAERWISAVAGADDEMASDPSPVMEGPQGSGEVIVLRLKGRPGLVGRILYVESLAAPRPQVWARRFDGAFAPDPAMMSRDRATKRARIGRGGGSYAFQDLAPGRYVVGLAPSGTRIAVSRVVEIVDRREHLDLEVPALDRNEFMPVRVVDGNGRPVQDARFMCKVRSNGGSRGGPVSSYRFADGSYLISRRPRLPNGPHGEILGARLGNEGVYVLKVFSSTRGETSLEYDPETRGLDIVLAETVDVEIRLLSVATCGLPREAMAYLTPTAPSDSIETSGQAQAVYPRGVLQFDGVLPGHWQLKITAPASLGHQQLLVLPLEISTRTPRVELTLPSFHTLEVSGLGERKSTLLRIDAAGNWVHQIARSSDDGVVRFEHVPPGVYEVRTQIDGQWKSLRVPMGPSDKAVRIK